MPKRGPEAALNARCDPSSIAEVIFQTAVYAGVPATNTALKALRSALMEAGVWPVRDGDGPGL
ncbi:MAG: carboxymuconolactone decarboxylase family protein [Desulfobacterales bacterium]